MTPQEALAILGLGAPCTIDDARGAFRSLVRQHHPDVASDPTTGQAARITQAYAVLRSLAAEGDGTSITVTTAAQPDPQSAPEPTPRAPTAYERAVAAELADGDTIRVDAPAGEAFGALFEAAGQVGHIGYFDRHLGILETIVRFEGGPSCSVLTTLQGSSDGTDVFCTMESIESAPTPPIGPVVDALVAALRSPA